MSDITAQELIERQKEVFGDQTVEPKNNVIQPRNGQIQIQKKLKMPAWLKKIRWWYVTIGSVDMGIGAVSFGASGHIPIIQIVLGAFGAAATIGRVQAYRYALSLRGKMDAPSISRRRWFKFAWIVGIFAATYFGLHFENAITNAQSVATAIINSKAQTQKNMVDELAAIATRRPEYDKGMADAIKMESWNSRDSYKTLIESDTKRVEIIGAILKNEDVVVAVSARDMFGGIVGQGSGQFMTLLGFFSVHLFMELMLALFASPLVVEKKETIKSHARRRSRRGKSRPSAQ